MKIADGLRRDLPRMDRLLVPLIQSKLPWLCNDLVVYSPTPEGNHILLVDRKEPPVKGVLWFPGGRKLKNVGLEASVWDKLKGECGITQESGAARIVRQLPARDFSSANDLPYVPGSGFSALDDGFHAVSINYAVEMSKTAGIRLDDTSAGHRWFTMPELRAYGQSIGGFHPYFAEVVNDASPELGLSPRLAITDVNAAKYGLPADDFGK